MCLDKVLFIFSPFPLLCNPKKTDLVDNSDRLLTVQPVELKKHSRMLGKSENIILNKAIYRYIIQVYIY